MKTMGSSATGHDGPLQLPALHATSFECRPALRRLKGSCNATADAARPLVGSAPDDARGYVLRDLQIYLGR